VSKGLYRGQNTPILVKCEPVVPARDFRRSIDTMHAGESQVALHDHGYANTRLSAAPDADDLGELGFADDGGVRYLSYGISGSTLAICLDLTRWRAPHDPKFQPSRGPDRAAPRPRLLIAHELMGHPCPWSVRSVKSVIFYLYSQSFNSPHHLTSKQILGDLNSCFGQSDVGSVAKQQRISVPIADPEADGAAQYCPYRLCADC
jgi:hypothetical protein